MHGSLRKTPIEQLFERIDNQKSGERVIIGWPLGTVNVGIKAFKRSIAHLPKGARNKLIREYKGYAWEKTESTIAGLRGESKAPDQRGGKKGDKSATSENKSR